VVDGPLEKVAEAPLLKAQSGARVGEDDQTGLARALGRAHVGANTAARSCDRWRGERGWGWAGCLAIERVGRLRSRSVSYAAGHANSQSKKATPAKNRKWK